MDTQKVEIIGRNRLVNELLQAGFEVAEPLRDRGVDLIAYIDVDDAIDRFIAIPIQMKAATLGSFGVSRKYSKFPNLILAHVWGIGQSEIEPVTYALTQSEAVAVANDMGWTQTASWIDSGIYTTTRPSKRLLEYLEPYRMSPERWREKLLSLI